MPIPPYINRYYNTLSKECPPGKALIIFGARQVGKSTLIEHYLSQVSCRYKKDSGDDLSLRVYFSTADFKKIDAYVQGYDLIVIDEAQKISNIGEILKIIVDQHPTLQIIATGSSSFDLAGQIGEPLTGRKKTLTVYPIAQLEALNYASPYELKEQLETFLIYGSYPEVLEAKTLETKKEIITEISNAYLLKDILELDRVKNPKALHDLLRLLAFQIGQEVSYTELAQQLMIDTKTVARYCDLLEKAFVVYNLRGFSRNLRKELTKKSKYYFYDVGLRNALIANFNPLSLRSDIGQLWENFLISERLKKQSYHNIYSNNYFWRTWNQKEIDWIEERDGQLFAYEFKWNVKVAAPPKDWQLAYPESTFLCITQDNYMDFIT